MKGICNYIPEKIDAYDRNEVIPALLQTEIPLNDNESHLINRLNSKPAVKYKLSESLLEMKVPLIISFYDFYRIINDQSD